MTEETGEEEEESGRATLSHPSRSILNDSKELDVRPGRRSIAGADLWRSSSFQALGAIKTSENIYVCHSGEAIVI